VTVGAQHPKVLWPMIVVHSVHVMKLDREWFTHPVSDATKLTSLLDEAFAQ
jgi:hypothetical protein